MDTDRNLLFGVIALQTDLIDSQQFIDACAIWTNRKNVSLANLLMERGWISEEDRSHVEFLLEKKIAKHGGDSHKSLAAATDVRVRNALAAVPGSEAISRHGD